MENADYPRDIPGLIENGELEEAQKLLDEQNERDGRWHYLQSKLYLKKGWHLESRKQLEIALKLEPDNSGYRAEYESLKGLGDAPYDAQPEAAAEGLDGKDKKRSKKCGCTADDCFLLGSECACECCMTGLCEAICNGCS